MSIRQKLDKYIDNYEDIYLIEEKCYMDICFAYNKKEGRECTLKIIDKNKLKLNEYILDKIKKGAEINKLYNSENIVQIYNKYENKNYFILELENYGNTLYSYIQDNGNVKKEIFKKIVIDLAKALKIIHSNGIIHRDIQLNNIYIKENENEDKKLNVKIGNFDSSIYMKENIYDSAGNLHYSSPEMIKNLKYNEKCDLYSLGVVLYQLYFGKFPYSYKAGKNTIIDNIYDEKKIILKKTKIPTLDILFRRLLELNPENRMNDDEFFKLVFNNDFMKKDKIPNEYKNYYDIISKEADLKKYELYNIEIEYPEETVKKRGMEDVINIIYEWNLPDPINLKIINNLNNRYNNIIYYDENVNKINSIYKDCNLFEENIIGAFILCTNIESLDYICKEILRRNDIEKNIIFNLMVTGSTAEKIIKFLNENKKFNNCVQNIFIYCYDKKKYLPLKKKYKIIKDVYNRRKEVINFINELSSEKIKPFSLYSYVSYQNYLNKYKNVHLHISKYYGDLTIENYKEYIEKYKSFFEKDEFESDKIISDFSWRKDLSFYKILLEREIIKDAFIYDENKYFLFSNITKDINYYYFISRSMYYSNYYALHYDAYCKTNNKLLYMGDKLPYSLLLKYEEDKGNIITFSKYLTVFEDEFSAYKYSGSDCSIESYETNYKFSVIFYITYLYKENWIPNLISFKIFDRTINYFLPFSFYHLKDIKINLKNYSSKIYLETIGRTEILEEKIRIGKEIEYNEKENIMQIKV